ncbi:MAG: hypothetical protein DRJ34_00025 [Thermoprotei archaeon]|nr:MAG: hypothetical protein DRJ34_00025 [Thermoprotei archaeon]
MVKYLVLSWQDYQKHVFNLADKISLSEYRIDKIICIARGGLVVGRILSDLLDVNNIECIGIQFYTNIGVTGEKPILKYGLSQSISGLKILLVDDIVDSGETLMLAEKYLKSKKPGETKTASIFIKPWSKYTPNYYSAITDRWVIFPYEMKESCLQLLKKYFDNRNKNIDIAKKYLTTLGFDEDSIKYILSKIWHRV